MLTINSRISLKCVQRYKYINMVQTKIEKHNELKYRGKHVFNYDRKYKEN